MSDSDRNRGEVAAVIATAGVPDKDGDVLLPGAIMHGSPVLMSTWNHDAALHAALPVGAGRIFQEKVDGADAFVFRGKYFVDLPHAHAAWGTIRALQESGVPVEWSWVWPNTTVREGPLSSELRARGAKRVMASVTPREVSPVLVGASRGTRTLEARAEDRERLEAAAADEAVEQEFMRVIARSTRFRREDPHEVAVRREVERFFAVSRLGRTAMS